MKIPCETIVRFSNLLPSPNVDIDPIFRTIRLDNGKIIATDRRFMAIEQLPEKFEGVFHISLPDDLLEQCRTETQFSSKIDIIATPVLGHITAKTTLGWSPPGNIGVFPAAVTDFDYWRNRVVAPCLEPAAVSRGGMLWRLDDIVRLAACSPSGDVIFEEHIDCESRPTVVRDIHSYDWCGFFLPRLHDGAYHAAATLPGWLKA